MAAGSVAGPSSEGAPSVAGAGASGSIPTVTGHSSADLTAEAPVTAAPTSPPRYDAGGVIAQITVGSTPTSVAYDNQNGDMYVANSGANTLSVISGVTNSVVATVPMGTTPEEVGYDSTNGDVYVANSFWNNVSVISGVTNSVVATVPVGTSPEVVGYDSTNGDVYVANFFSNNVSVISGVTNKVVATIPVGTHPFGVGYDSANGNIYVSNSGTDNVCVISGVTNTVVATIPVGTYPHGVGYDSANGNIYVANYVSNNVSEISGTTNAVVATIPVGTNPVAVTYDDGNGNIYVANNAANTVSVISDVSNTVVATISVGASPWHVAYDSGNGDVYVADSGSNSVSVISTLLAVRAVSPLLRGAPVTGTVSTTVGVGSLPGLDTFDPDNGNIYVATGANTVSVVSGVTNTLAATIPLGSQPQGIGVDSGNGYVYVATSANIVSVVSGVTNTVVATVSVGTSPYGVAYDSGNGDVYVSNYGSNNVSVISGTTNGVVATVAVGAHPFDDGYDSANGDIYVANYGAGTVSVISGLTNAVVATIPVGSLPEGVGYDSANGYVYITNWFSNSVSVISGATNTVVATVPVGTGPSAVGYDSGNGDVYVSNYGSNNVSVISGATNAVVGSVSMNGPNGVAYDNENGAVYVTNYRLNSVSVVPTLSAPVKSPPASLDVGQTILFSAPLLGQGAGGDQLSVSLTPPTGMSCSVDPLGYTLISGACLATSVGTYAVTFTVQDVLGTTVSTSIDVTVYPDPAANAPLLTPSSVDWGQAATLSVSPTGGTGTFSYVWTGLPSECPSVDRSSISCQPSSSTGSFPVGVSVTDSNNFTVVAPATTLRIYADPTVASFTGTASSVDVGQTDVFSVFMSGGTGTFSYSWSGLPPGCNTVDTARLSCTPTSTVGNPFIVGVTATDSNGVSVPSSGFSLAVLADPVLSQPTSTMAAADVGMGVTFTSTASLGSGGYSASVLSLAAGLGCGAESVTGTSVQLVCAPKAAGTYSVSLAVVDSNGVVANSPAISFTVNPDPVVTAPTASVNSTEPGGTVVFSTHETGGTGALFYAWNVAGGLGLSCPTSSSVPTISCTATAAGNFSINLNAVDSLGYVTPLVISGNLEVYSTLEVATLTASRTFADVGQSVVFTATTAGGSGGLHYLWSGLPQGCTSVDGPVLTCTPSSPGNFNVQVTVADSDGFHSSTSSVLASVLVMSSPQGVAYDPGRGETFVADSAGNNVSVIDDSTRSVVNQISIPDPVALAYDSATNNVYVTSFSTNSVYIVSGITLAILQTIPVSAGPDAIVFDPVNCDMYVANADNGPGTTVSVIYACTVVISAYLTLSGFSDPVAEAFDSANEQVYVVNEQTNTVTVLSGSSPTITNLGTISGFGRSPEGIAFDSANGDLYVTNTGSNNVSVISGRTNTVVGALATGASPIGVTDVPADGDLYITTRSVTGSGAVSILDPYSGLTLNTVPVGSNPLGIALDPGLGEVYVANANSNNVSVFAASAPVSLEVFSVTTFLSITTDRSALDVGQTVLVTAQVTVPAGGALYAWSGLPSGCSGTSTLNVTCVPTVQGTFFPMASVTDGNGVTVSSGKIAIVVSPPPTVVSVVNSRGTVDTGQGLTFTASGTSGSGGDTLQWTGLPSGCTTSDVWVLSCTPQVPGTFTPVFTVTDSNGMSVSLADAPFVVSPAPALTSLTSSAASVDVGMPVAFTLAVSGGNLPLVMTWTNSSTVSGCPLLAPTSGLYSITCVPTHSGTFTVSVTAVDGNSVSVSGTTASVTVYSDPVIGISSVTPASADVGETVTFASSVSGGSGGDTYVWVASSANLGCGATDLPTLTCTPTSVAGSPFSVSVSVTDSNGKTTTSPALLYTVDPALGLGVTVSLPPARPFMDVGQTVVFTASATAGAGTYTFSWTGVSSSDGCVSAWSGGTGWLNCTPSASAGGTSFSAAATAMDGNGVSKSVSSIPVVVSPDPTVSTPVAGRTSLDVGQTVVLTTTATPGSGGDHFVWSGLPTGCSTANTTSITCKPTAPSNGSMISVSVTDSNGGTEASGPVLVTVSSPPSLGSLAWSPGAIDLGQSTTLTATGTSGSGGLAFAWSGLPSGCSGLNVWAFSCTPGHTGSSLPTLTITDSNGANATLTGSALTVYADPTITTPTVSRSLLDDGQTTTLSALATVATGTPTYAWAGLPMGCTGTSTLTVSCTPPTGVAGSYTVTVSVTDGNGMTVTSGAITLVLSPPPTVTGLSGSVTSLDVGQSLMLTVTGTQGSGGDVGTWSGAPAGCSSPSLWVLSCAPTSTGNFSVTVSVVDSNGGSATWATPFTFSVSLAPTAGVPTSTAASVDIGQTLVLSAQATPGSGGASYYWWGLPTGCATQNSATLSCTPTSPGSYLVGYSIRDSNGMNVSSSPARITVSPALGSPGISATTTAVDVGMGFSLTVTITGGASPDAYVWSGLPSGCPSVDGPSLSCIPAQSGTYTVSVTVTDGNGVAKTSAGTAIDVSAAPLAGTLTVSKSSLDLGVGTNLSVNPVVGTASFNVVWHGLPPGCASANATALSCTPKAPGTYSVWVTVTDSNGGSATGSPQTITVFPSLGTATLTVSATTVDLGESLSVAAIISGGSGAYTYAWYGLPSGCLGSDSGALTCVPSAAGNRTLSVTVTDSTGSTASASATVTVNPALRVTLSASPTSATGPTTLTFTASVSGGTGAVGYAWYLNGSLLSGKTSSSITLPGADPGTYTVGVEVMDGTGATASSLPASVVVSPKAASSTGASPTSVTTSPTWADYLLVVLVAILVLLGIALLLQLRSRRGGGTSTVEAPTRAPSSNRAARREEAPGGPTPPRPAPASPPPAPGASGEVSPSEYTEE